MKNTKIALVFIAFGVAPSLLWADRAADQKIENETQSSYTFRTVLEGRVKVDANDGVVTLTGTVPDPDQRKLAEDTVNEMPGVVRVDNEVQVDPNQRQGSDAWIAFKIHTDLLMKANVSTTATHVDVRDGVVTLTGTAESEAQKQLTSAYVKDIAGVREVHNDIVVSDRDESESGGDSAIDDASITAQIKYELLANPATSAIHTKVATHDGVVDLAGSAANDAERDLATKLAQGVRGVKAVNNDMTVGGR
jgi:hyperosmotically inducible protein